MDFGKKTDDQAAPGGDKPEDVVPAGDVPAQPAVPPADTGTPSTTPPPPVVDKPEPVVETPAPVPASGDPAPTEDKTPSEEAPSA